MRRPTTRRSWRTLIDGIDAYVNDAFGASHRAHASIVGPPQHPAVGDGPSAGEKEVDVLLGLRNDPRRPFVAVLGGSKISDKLGVVEALLDVVDSLVIGGAMCFTFLAAQGNPIGGSLFEPDQVDTCKRLLDDTVTGSRAAGKTIRPARRDICSASTPIRNLRHLRRCACPTAAKGFDIGPGSAAAFSDVIMDARTVFWNGPMGMFEDERFAARGRAPSPRRWPRRRRSRSSAAATRPRRSPSSAWTTRSTTCRPAAGRRLELLELGDLPRPLRALRVGGEVG